MPLSLSLVELDQAWAGRLEHDVDFVAAIGLDANAEVRLYRGWPHELQAHPAKQDLPRTTYFRVDRQTLTADPELVLIQSDTWAWRDQLNNLVMADNAMLAAFTDGKGGAKTWYDAVADLYVSTRLVDQSDPPEPVLVRRRHLWEIAPA